MKLIESPNTILPTKEIVATIGFFDGVHLGHRFLLDYIVSYANEHQLESAAITFPVHPRKVLSEYYQPETLTEFNYKIDLIGRTTQIDYTIVIPFTSHIGSLTAREFIELLKTNYRVSTLVMGYDHQFGSDRLSTFDEYVACGMQCGVKVIQATPLSVDGTRVSSSLVRKLLLAGNIRQTTKILDRHYRITGEVIHGYGIGHQLGFPTANIRIQPSDQLLPRTGVYAVWAYIEDCKFGGMANIGLRPTIHEAGGLSVEINLFEFDDDLYGKIISFELVEFLRPEKKLDSRQELTSQLHLDKIMAKKTLLTASPDTPIAR